jgi:thiaminase
VTGITHIYQHIFTRNLKGQHASGAYYTDWFQVAASRNVVTFCDQNNDNVRKINEKIINSKFKM